MQQVHVHVLVVLTTLLSTATLCRADALEPVRRGQLVLREGSRGAAVRELQEALNRAGQALAEDGAFGPRTRAGVVAFQRAQGLVVDGMVGRRTMAALDGVAPAPPPPAPPSPAPPGGAPPGVRPVGIPPRPLAAPSGSAWLANTAALTRAQREDQILAELEAGNLPEFLRTFRVVSVRGVGGDGLPHSVELQVMPDVLAIGSDADFVRIGMGSRTAQRVADRFGCLLPTREISRAIHAAASVKLTPAPLPPSAAMMSNGYFARHQARVEEQWRASGAARGELVAGHKKDVVLSARLRTRPERVAIYGWHYPDGRAIQPLSTVHAHDYADYSHGIRLVHATARVDGLPRSVADVLADPLLHPLLSDEGPLYDARIPGVGPAPATPAPPAPRPAGPPASLRRLSNGEVTPAISAEAVRILREHRGDPIGTEVWFVADGKHYVARIELHYHPPGGPQRPWGHHPGVSVLEPVW